MKTLPTLALSAVVAMSATSVFADNLADTIMARPSTEASVGVHMTLGGKAQAEAKPVYGASLGFRKGGETVSQSFKTPAAKVAEFNFSGGKVQDARIGTMNFATSEAVTPTGDRLNFDGVSGMTWLWIGLGVAVIWYVVDQNNNGSNSGY